MKGLRVNVYRTPVFGDCTNAGLSCYYNRFTLVGAGVPEVDEPTREAPAIALVGGHAVPLEGGQYFFGGNFIHATDSRFDDISPQGLPLPIHDRQE